MKKLLLLLLMVVSFASLANAQNVRKDDVAMQTVTQQTSAGTVSFLKPAVSTITVCSSAGTGIPCTPTVPICSSATDAVCSQPNPFTTDANGNYGFWVAPGRYVVTISGVGLTGKTITYDLPVGLTNTGDIASATQLQSTVATGTPPLIVTSTTVVPNLTVNTAATATNATNATNLSGPGTITGAYSPSGLFTFNAGLTVPLGQTATVNGALLVTGTSTFGNGSSMSANCFSNHNGMPWAGGCASTVTIDQAVTGCTTLSIPLACYPSVAPGYALVESTNLFTTSTGYKVYTGTPTIFDYRNNLGVYATTAASVTGNVATLTLASPAGLTMTQLGWSAGQVFNVYGFTGADTYFNGGPTITAVGSNTVSYALTHANASASTNGIAQNPKAPPVYPIIFGGRCYGQLVRQCVNYYSNSPLDSASGAASVLLLTGNMLSNGQQAGAINIFSTVGSMTFGSSTANYTGTDSEAYHAASSSDIAMPYLSAYVGQAGINQNVNASVTTVVTYAGNGCVNAGSGTITNCYTFDAFPGSANPTSRKYGYHANVGANWLTENGTHFDAVDASNATHPIFTFLGTNVVQFTPMTNAQGFQFSNVGAGTPWFNITSAGIVSQIAHNFVGSAQPLSNAGAFLGGSSNGWAGLYLAEGAAPGQTGGMTVCGAVTAVHALECSYNGGPIGQIPLGGPNLLISPTAPTIAAGGCGGTVATINNPNGTASFDIFTGTAPTSGGCTITLPAAAHHWHCEANHTSAISTTNFIIQQTDNGASTTSVTLQLFSDVAAATAPTASDTWRTTCTAN